MRRLTVLLALAVAACASRPPAQRAEVPPAGEPAPLPPRRADPGDGPVVRVALLEGVRSATLSATGSWRMFRGERAGTVVARGAAGESWTVEAGAGTLRLRRADGVPTEWLRGPVLVRALNDDALVSVDGKRYRGEVLLVPGPDGVMVVNHLPMEWYLRGVVPLEIGPDRRDTELAAAEAQAVAARSYALVKLREAGPRAFDVRASVLDQVYGGVAAERRLSDSAVRGTAGLVLRYQGRPVNAPYHSACGGSTAEPQEVWRSSAEPYLRRVSDRIPGTDRHYCDLAPRARWTRTWSMTELDTLVVRYLSRANGGRTARGHVRQVRVEGVTPSGRAEALVVDTDGGTVRLRGNEMRSVFRSATGEMLNSTYVSVQAAEQGARGLTRLTLRGQGYGHGIGLCQWGAIGRARAGQDFRTILATYYPGTTIDYLD